MAAGVSLDTPWTVEVASDGHGEGGAFGGELQQAQALVLALR